MNYPLDLASPVRHVATEMERADHALSISELVATYSHPIPADVGRVKKAEGLRTDKEALVWIVERALEEIKRYVDNGDGNYRLKVPFEKVRFQRRSIHRVQPRDRFEDSFDPMSGKFSENIRAVSVGREGGFDDELRDSLKKHGWNPHLPAIRDERGVVLVGHRRLAIAEELGVDPVYLDVRFGSGDESDAQRFALAIVSNVGAKPFNTSDRRRIAKYLYGEYEWSMERIAEALKVSQKTISNDLVTVTKSTKRGRPRTRLTAAQEEEAQQMFSEGKSRDQVAKKLGVGVHAAQLAQQRYFGAEKTKEKAKTEAKAEAKTTEQAKPSTKGHCPNCGFTAELKAFFR